MACAVGPSSVNETSIRGFAAGRRDRLQPLERSAGQLHGGPPARKIDDAHIAPENAAPQAGAERFGAGFLGGETAWRRFRRVFARRSALARSVAVKMRSRKRSPWRSITSSMRRTSTISEPSPMIMPHPLVRSFATFLRPRSIAARMNFTTSRQALEYRFADQEMTDVEFDHLRQRGDRFGSRVVEPVAGMDFKPEIAASCAPSRMSSHSACASATRPSVSASHQAPVWISITGAPSSAAVSIWRRRRPDEQRDADAGMLELAHDRRKLVMLPDRIEPAFGRALRALFRHEAGRMRPASSAQCRPFRRSPPFRN